MKSNVVAALLVAALATMATAHRAEARNPNCSGGILRVDQALREKEKGNHEDYRRQINKAVELLQACAREDPKDHEAVGYLGWAYAEVESAGPAGATFQKAIEGLTSKGDKKKVEWAVNNRDSYWAKAFNDGIAKINAAQEAYDPFTKTPENDAEKTLRDEAAKRYGEAIASLTRASLLKPGDLATLRNIGTAHALMGEFPKAEEAFLATLKVAPGDTLTLQSLRSVRANRASAMIDEKKFDEAIAFYQDLVKTDASNADLHLGIAEAYFKRAEAKEGDARKPDFKLAGDAYAKAAAIKTSDANLPFNAALAYQRSGEAALAEAQWRATLKLRPGDEDAILSLGGVLVDLKRPAEAIRVLHEGVVAHPKNRNLHRQLGVAYRAAGNEAKDVEESMTFLALLNGKAEGDAAAAAAKAPAGSAAAKTLQAEGGPEEVYTWEASGDKLQSWFYWGKRKAYHFKDGALVTKTDWTSADTKLSSRDGK